jgi:hypothetical protein
MVVVSGQIYLQIWLLVCIGTEADFDSVYLIQSLVCVYGILIDC